MTSPGVDRPLTEQRHWRRNTGRLVTVAVGPAGAAQEVTARITAVDAAGVTLAVEAQGRPGAKKKAPTPRNVPWAELGSGRVQVEFGRPGRDDGAALDDGSGDDASLDHVDDDLMDDPELDDSEPGTAPRARGGAQ
ncbi:hypothetical protein [Blastococcus brunescens]|uniref:Ribosome maturation factor RimP C-terminal domain-containing protein n=1 Tax=Blastococcus brunescens TaxID=1564165 RepID=A0ABZ1AYL0_9ACTN|nr:hypothetical protein [Blastococcus sp. BMG 8361]WRL62513.1 hypothetical protein U6N30_21280 [Blastococcus sp. BMG 8361]